MAAKKKNDTQEEVQSVKEEAVQEEETAYMRGRVKGGSLNVRRAPTLGNNIIRVLADGEEINLIKARKNARWFQTKDGFYVMSEFIELI